MARTKGKRRHQRGEGSWYFDAHAQRWVAVLSVTPRGGKRRRIKRTARDKSDAPRLLARLQREYGRAGEVAFTTLDDYLGEWLSAVQPTVTASTYTSYEGHVRMHISPLLGGIDVGNLRPSDVNRLIRDRLAASLSPATVQRIVTTLRMALGQAVRDGELLQNVALVKLPRVEREPVEAMTQQRADAILEAVRGDRLGAMYVLLLGTGMRVGEACALDWQDIDLDTATLFVRRGKTRAATRTLPLPRFVVEAMRSHRVRAPRYGPQEPVFLGERKSERLRVDHVGHHLAGLLAAAELPPMRAHDLRHGTATLLLAKGVPMRVISEILGHANPAVTANTYAHVTQESKREAIETLDEVTG